jgi:hypothetical protein
MRRGSWWGTGTEGTAGRRAGEIRCESEGAWASRVGADTMLGFTDGPSNLDERNGKMAFGSCSRVAEDQAILPPSTSRRMFPRTGDRAFIGFADLGGVSGSSSLSGTYNVAGEGGGSGLWRAGVGSAAAVVLTATSGRETLFSWLSRRPVSSRTTIFTEMAGDVGLREGTFLLLRFTAATGVLGTLGEVTRRTGLLS